MVEIKGRAITPEQKREVIERIYNAWLKAPQQRLGQLISNATYNKNTIKDIFYVEDEDLAEKIEELIGRIKNG